MFVGNAERAAGQKKKIHTEQDTSKSFFSGLGCAVVRLRGSWFGNFLLSYRGFVGSACLGRIGGPADYLPRNV